MVNKYLFLDSNILRFIANRNIESSKFQDYLFENDLVLVLSLIQVLEVYKVPRSQELISKMLLSVPSAFLKWWRPILLEESTLYPNTENVDVIVRPFISDLIHNRDENDLLALLRAYDIGVMWEQLQNKGNGYLDYLGWLSTTVPEDKSKRFIDIDYSLHNYSYVVHMLKEINRSFVELFKPKSIDLTVENFRGEYLRGAYLYYRYIINRMNPSKSDYADLLQVFYMPYCKIVVVEKSMAGYLYRLQSERGLLPNTQIESIRFARNLMK